MEVVNKEAAKAEYLARKMRGEPVRLKTLASELGITYRLLREWKTEGNWDSGLKGPHGPKMGNQNAKGHKNAKGCKTSGAPKGSHNAEKDGAYSSITFETMTEAERELAENTSTNGKAALEYELRILRVREHRILTKIDEYESQSEEELYVTSTTDYQVPSPGGNPLEIERRMCNKDSAFNRILKLQEALYRVQGRIATVASSLRAIEEADIKIAIEKERLAIMRMRAIGAIEVDDVIEEGTDEAIYE